MQETMTRKKGRYMSRRFPAILIAFLMVCAMLPAEALEVVDELVSALHNYK